MFLNWQHNYYFLFLRFHFVQFYCLCGCTRICLSPRFCGCDDLISPHTLLKFHLILSCPVRSCERYNTIRMFNFNLPSQCDRRTHVWHIHTLVKANSKKHPQMFFNFWFDQAQSETHSRTHSHTCDTAEWKNTFCIHEKCIKLLTVPAPHACVFVCMYMCVMHWARLDQAKLKKREALKRDSVCVVLCMMEDSEKSRCSVLNKSKSTFLSDKSCLQNQK